MELSLISKAHPATFAGDLPAGTASMAILLCLLNKIYLIFGDYL
jgi:hypothetical protein